MIVRIIYSFVIMSFYVTLPSDSSMNYFSDNKISHFVTRLPSPLELKGEWEVGLTEFIYPHMWNNLQENATDYEYDIGNGVLKKIKIPCGYYESPLDIIKWINYQDFKNKIDINYNKHTKKVKVVLKDKARLIFHEGLAECLGFPPGEVGDNSSVQISGTRYIQSPNVADPNFDFKLLYIYSDIVDSQIIGDSVAPLLRVITVKGNDGDMVHEMFDRPHYVTLVRKNFQTIETVIRTHAGRLVSFDRGKLIVKLHFRQKYLS